MGIPPLLGQECAGITTERRPLLSQGRILRKLGQEQDRKYKQVSICFAKNKNVARCKARRLGNDFFLRIFSIILSLNPVASYEDMACAQALGTPHTLYIDLID